MCWHTNRREDVHSHTAIPNLPREDLLSLLASPAFQMTTISVVGGGEPFLYPYLEELLQNAPTAQRRLMIMTNGTLLHKYPIFWEIAAHAKITLMFSIDAATPETYSQVRPPGLWDDLMGNLERFLELRQRNHQLELSSSFVVLKQNVPELLDFLKLNAAWGSNYVHLHPAIKSNFPDDWRVDVHDPAYIRTINAVKEYAHAHNIALDRVEELLPPGDSLPMHGNGAGDPRRGCRLPAEAMTISPQGEVYICDTAFRVYYACGNVFTGSFADAWLSTPWLSVRLAHALGVERWHPLCQHCLLVAGQRR
jgi:radical SAM protein with 4Fe4S-binding SPASM domain